MLRNIILPDVHLDDKGYAPVYGVVKKFIKDFKPDIIYLLGDYADCSALSHWSLAKAKRRKIEGKRHKTEIDIIKKELDYLQKYSKNIVWLEGNHENWVEQYLDINAEMEGLAEYPVLLNLKDRNIKWIPQGKLHKVGKLYMFHGKYVNTYHAKKHMEKFGCSIVYAHGHNSQTYTNNQVMQPTHKAWGLGCLCNKKPDYLKGIEGSWNHEFATQYIASNGDFNLYPVDIVNNRFFYNGKQYS
jgi:hypothetical protein